MSALYLGAFLGLNRLILEIDGSLLGSQGMLGWFVGMHFLHFALFLFIICSLVMFIVSYMTPEPDYSKISNLIYNRETALTDSDDTDEERRKDKYLSLLLFAVVIIIWIIFS